MTNRKIVVENRKARHEYELYDRYEAGLELKGTEIKSIRLGKVQLRDSYISIRNGQAFIKGMHISPYEKDGLARTDPIRERQLLMHKREILRLFGKIKQDGLTLIPLNLHWSGSNVKVQIGLCKGKKLYDKRQSAAEQAAKRQIDRTMKSQYR